MKSFSTEIELFDQMAQSNYVATVKWTILFFKLPVLWLQALFFPLTYNVPDSTAEYLRSKRKTERQRLRWFVRVNATKRNTTPITKNYEDSLLTRKKRCLLQTHFCIFPKYKEGTSTVLCCLANILLDLNNSQWATMYTITCLTWTIYWPYWSQLKWSWA